ncbi:MAG TPA: hypothetical protein PKV96_02205 [Candidatus Saccharimonas sp.]|nr:hypothetical protein [Candidatus Saccharimonas sp.]
MSRTGTTNERGLSVVIEGNDGTGKSTQVEMLADWLWNIYGTESLTIHEPDGPTERCQELRRMIKDATILRTPEQNLAWFTESRSESNRYGREHYIDRGKAVLRARNWRSTEAYQGGGQGLPYELIRNMTAVATDELYMSPDLEVILYVDPYVRATRISSRGELEVPDTFESMGDAFQTAVDNRYLHIAARDHLPLIEASPPAAVVQQQIRELIWLRGLLRRV